MKKKESKIYCWSAKMRASEDDNLISRLLNQKMQNTKSDSSLCISIYLNAMPLRRLKLELQIYK